MLDGSILTFADYHGRKNIGSSRIRGDWVMKHWPKELGTCEHYIQAKPYDFVIYQKVYWPLHAESYQGVKILDMCDADWYDWEYDIVRMMRHMDAVTTSTESLAKEVRKIVKGMVTHGDIESEIPVVFIPDRMDPEWHKEKKTTHAEKIEWVTWYGYGHNLRTIESAVPYLKKNGYKLCVISDRPYPKADKNIPWTEETINRDLIENSDIVINPHLEYGKWQHKSDNKTTSAWALGIPVARSVEELESLLTKEAREQEAKKRMEEVARDYHPRKSALQYGRIILEAFQKRAQTEEQVQ